MHRSVLQTSALTRVTKEPHVSQRLPVLQWCQFYAWPLEGPPSKFPGRRRARLLNPVVWRKATRSQSSRGFGCVILSKRSGYQIHCFCAGDRVKGPLPFVPFYLPNVAILCLFVLGRLYPASSGRVGRLFLFFVTQCETERCLTS